VRALTDAQVEVIPLQRLLRLCETQPRLATKILWSFACETAIYIEHLILVGRRSALERVAHFLLELLTRLQLIGAYPDLTAIALRDILVVIGFAANALCLAAATLRRRTP
jgi:CRP-like cAMP-binding protein